MRRDRGSGFMRIVVWKDAAEPHRQLPHDDETRVRVLQRRDIYRLRWREHARRLHAQRRCDDWRDLSPCRWVDGAAFLNRGF